MRRRTEGDTEKHYRNALLRPPERTWRQKIRDLIWDKKNKQCLTRSPINWLAISVYYALFLAGTLLVFYISMSVAKYMASRNHNRPQYILGDSPVGSSPTLNFFPLKNERSLIWLSEGRSYSEYVDIIKNEFNRYGGKIKQDELGSCSNAPFGYDKKSPCIFLRLSRIIMWEPTPYHKGDSLPDNVPKQVQHLIQTESSPRIWLSCNGTTAKDRDHMKEGFFKIQGKKGFDVKSFPFDRQKDYVDSIVAVQFSDPGESRVLYSFTCTAWAKGLDVKVAKTDVSYYFE